MKIGLVGSTNDQRSLPFDAQRSINLFPVLDQQGKEIAALYSAPGKLLFSTLGLGPVRGGFKSTNDRVFAVSGNTLYEVSSDGTSTNLGTLESSTGNISIAENSTQMAICDRTSLYILTYATNTFVKVTDADLPTSVGMVAYSDGYFIVNENSTGKLYVSDLRDGTSWDALKFATAESSPDNLSCIVNAVGGVWLFGTTSTEVWTQTGDSSFPFRRISGAKLEVGILSPFSAVEIDNSVIWIGKDKFGHGIVYKAQGFSPVRISTSAIERRIQSATSPEDIKGYAYQDDGNTFLVFTGGGLETSLCYDLTTQQWHERAFLNSYGIYETDRAFCHCFAFGKHLVGDKENGNIYELSMDYYSDDEEELSRERIYTHLSDEGQRLRYNALEIGIETGVGLTTGAGSDPVISLALSKDGARTWIDCGSVSIGKIGQFQKKVEFRRLGIAEQMTFKIRITDKVKVAITGSYLR